MPWQWMKRPNTVQALLLLLRECHGTGVMDQDTLNMLEGALKVSSLKARDCMVPQAQMIVLQADETPESFIPKIITSRHSRFPVTNSAQDHVLGIVLAKEVLDALWSKGKDFTLGELIRPCAMIPESKPLDQLLKELRVQHQHMAIVLDEYGGVAGLMTIEDIIEHIVGDIEDEHFDEKAEEPAIKPVHDHEWIVHGLTPIEDINEQLGLTLQTSMNTLGGLVAKSFGYFPNAGETIELQGITCEVLSADKRRLSLLRLTRPQP